MKVFWAFTRQAFHNTVIYRFEFWLRLFSIFLSMYGIYWVWKVLYTQKPGAFNVSFEQMVTYGVLGMALELFLDVGPEWYIANQVRTGAIDTDLMKPLDFHFHMLARSSGEMLFSLGILALPTFIIGHFLFGLQLPQDAVTALLFAVSLVFSFLVFFHIGFLLGTMVLITLDIRNISWAYYSVVSFLAGQMLPLWLLPQFLRNIAEILPFKSIYYIPISIYIGTIRGDNALKQIGFQIIWTIILTLIARWSWARVQERITVQGG